MQTTIKAAVEKALPEVQAELALNNALKTKDDPELAAELLRLDYELIRTAGQNSVDAAVFTTATGLIAGLNRVLEKHGETIASVPTFRQIFRRQLNFTADCFQEPFLAPDEDDPHFYARWRH